VQFGYALLATADYGALGMTVQEVGLFANGPPPPPPPPPPPRSAAPRCSRDWPQRNPVWASRRRGGAASDSSTPNGQYSALHDSGHSGHDGANVGDDTQTPYHRTAGGLDAAPLHTAPARCWPARGVVAAFVFNGHS